MVKGFASVKTTDHMASLEKQLTMLANKEVLVGIPEEESTRENGDDINNAELLYIHTHGVRKQEMRTEMQGSIDDGMKYSAAHSLYVREHGSPLMAIPPRPVMEPAIDDKKDIIGRQLAKVSQAALAGNPMQMEAELNKAGMIGEAAARGWFENPKNGWPPNSEKTIKRKGSDQPLVDTNSMRKAITYVVRDKND